MSPRTQDLTPRVLGRQRRGAGEGDVHRGKSTVSARGENPGERTCRRRYLKKERRENAGEALLGLTLNVDLGRHKAHRISLLGRTWCNGSESKRCRAGEPKRGAAGIKPLVARANGDMVQEIHTRTREPAKW